MIKVHYKETDGSVLHAYDESVQNIPTPFISVTLQQWQESEGKNICVRGGRLITTDKETNAQQKVMELEAKYQLPRPVRMLLLNSRLALDGELVARIEEIETYAEILRAGPVSSEEV